MLRTLVLSVALILPVADMAPAYDYDPKPIEELLDQGAQYDSAIPKPEDVLGFQLGQIIFTPDMHTAYIQAVAAVSDRVSVEIIGHSHFGRPILRVTTTSPRNQARLEEIRSTQHTLSKAESSPAPDDHPVIIQLTHGVHGSEASGYDSAPLVLYHLAAAQGSQIEALLEEVVVHQIVMINPDGANRFAEWTNLHHAQAPVADPQHREHYHDWPWGRTNHYWFDLNRQWIPVTQPESQALVKSTHEWRPNIAADLHEMGPNSTFFFSPGPHEGLHPLLSQAGLQLNLDMNTHLNDQLDSEGALFVTSEVFDDFYLGYGSSYPGLLGSVPYLFEQSSVRGLIQQTDYGILRYDDKVGQQARAALALIRAGQESRVRLHAHMQDFFDESRQMALADPIRGYVFSSSDRGRLADFMTMLATHDLEVYELAQPLTRNGHLFEPGQAFIVPMRQDQYRLVRGLFETRIITDKVEFYDVSGWTQPLAYDLDYAELRGGQYRDRIIGDRVTGFDISTPAPDRSQIAYVMEWDSYYAPRALYRLLDEGVTARVLPDEVSLQSARGEVQTGRGAIVAPVQRQPLPAEDIHALMERAAREDGVWIHAATSSHTKRGSDLGGFALSNVERPEILVVTGRGVSMNDTGEIWHLLDHDMHMPVTMIDLDTLGRADLERYTHIVLPGGSYSRVDEGFAERLQSWVRTGGVAIGVRGGSNWLIDNEIATATVVEHETEAADSATAPAYEGMSRWDAEMYISGAIFGTDLDITHPLGFGYRDGKLPIQRIGSLAFDSEDNPFALPVRYAEGDPLQSGYANRELREAMAGTGAVFAERQGAGAVILFADPPYYRAYFRGTAKLFMNAIFFGDDIRNPNRRSGD